MTHFIGERKHFTLEHLADSEKLTWILRYIEQYGQIDGDHHKAWVLDQIAQIIHDTPIETCIAEWKLDDNKILTEDRYHLGEPSEQYAEWVETMCDGRDGPETYSYDPGIAP